VAETTRALELWRGEPLPDLVDAPEYAGEIVRLRERRASAEEDLFEGRLQLGDHQGVIADLSAAVEEQPLRERRWAQLMLALYRTGRLSEAMNAYERLRLNLAEEHGTVPSAEISALENAIIMDRPELRWAPPLATGDTSPGPL
jgi:DNA-binding SARP family transcriptional activator